VLKNEFGSVVSSQGKRGWVHLNPAVKIEGIQIDEANPMQRVASLSAFSDSRVLSQE
jgi:hypothetical protein